MSPASLQEAKRQYDQDGFLKVQQLFSGTRLTEIEEQLTLYTEQIAPHVPADDIVYESESLPNGGRAIRNLWRMENHSRYFRELAKSEEVLQLVAMLVNGEPVLMGVELFAKPPRVGSAVPYHQDNGYFNLTPPDALTCWLALDASSLENGCVHYARGTHSRGLWPHKATNVPGNSWGLAAPPDPATLDEVPGILARGDAMLHHCCLLHRSEPNRSDRARRGLLLVYRGAHCQIDPIGMANYKAAADAIRARAKAQ